MSDPATTARICVLHERAPGPAAACSKPQFTQVRGLLLGRRDAATMGREGKAANSGRMLMNEGEL